VVVLTIRIELANVVAVQRSHDTNLRAKPKFDPSRFLLFRLGPDNGKHKVRTLPVSSSRRPASVILKRGAPSQRPSAYCVASSLCPGTFYRRDRGTALFA
jgi:hypothetical protein